MSRRGILKAEVKAALENRIRREAGQPGSIWVWGMAAGKPLKVCVGASEFPQKMVVITAARPGNDEP